MSRIGKKPIDAQSAEVSINGKRISIKGSRGVLDYVLPEEISATLQNKEILFSIEEVSKRASAMWGLSRSLVQNMVIGVTKGFEKKLEIQGIGYRASTVSIGQKSVLKFFLGYSHPIYFHIPSDIKVELNKQIISISGNDKEKVGKIASEIRALRPPEPYKGKGIRYLGELVRRKEGKKTK